MDPMNHTCRFITTLIIPHCFTLG